MRDFESRNERRRQRWEDKRRRWEARMERHANDPLHAHSHVWTGVFLLLVGGVSLAKSFGAPLPPWVFSWQMLLIAIGLFTGFRKGFGNGGWFVPLLIGTAFLLNDYFLDGTLRRHMWPLIIIVVGIFFIIRPRRRHRWHGSWQEKKTADIKEDMAPPPSETFSEDDYIDTTSIFGGTKKVVLSKNFRGGDMVNIFGGSEIDLTKADIATGQTAELEVTAIFGGATLLVPANWAVKSDAVTIFGGISDRRSVAAFTETSGKNLLLKGTVVFGGIEIKSYY